MSPSVSALPQSLPRRLSRVRRLDSAQDGLALARRDSAASSPLNACWADHWRREALDSSPIRWFIASVDSPTWGTRSTVGGDEAPTASVCLPQADSSCRGAEPQPPLRASPQPRVCPYESAGWSVRSVSLPSFAWG
jgi:hypothetical protein